MKPIEFKEQNAIFHKPEEMTEGECRALPAHVHSLGIVTCWKLSLLERLRVLFCGVIWVDIMSHNQPPLWLGVETPFVHEETEAMK